MLEPYLKTWRTLQRVIQRISEQECWYLLELEKSSKNRRLFLQCIYGRANKLREQRERQEMMRSAK